MDDLVMLDGPVPAFFRITDTAHGLSCETCRVCAGSAATHARVYGSHEGSMQCTDGYDIDHLAAVERVTVPITPT